MPVVDAEAEIVVEEPRREAASNEAPRSDDRRNDDRRPARNPGDSRIGGDRRPSENRYAPRYGNDRVVGMGDHVPDFILRSFRIETPATEETEEEQADS
jgi:hypothetical protein